MTLNISGNRVTEHIVGLNDNNQTLNQNVYRDITKIKIRNRQSGKMYIS